MHDLLLVSLPWAQADHLSIQLAGLKAYAASRGIEVAARHYYKDLYAYLPRRILDPLRLESAGEYLSVARLYPERATAVRRRLREILGEEETISELEAGFERFLDDCLADILTHCSEGTVLGFTTSLQQVVTSLLVARRVKHRRSRCRTLFGGAVLVPDVAREMMRLFPEVDLAIVGEGETALGELFAGGALDDPAQLPRVPNLLYRRNGRVEANAPTEIADLDQLPIPDYGEYFEHALIPGAVAPYPKIAVETSRGCFYDRCAFCNLSAQWQSRYRAKNVDRVVREIRSQVAAHRTTRVLFVDSNLANRGPLFERMAADPLHYHGWAEVSGHLRRATLVSLRRAGIRDIQVGIESFSPAMLARFRKGISAMRNMEMLKWCTELGIELCYNIIVEFPDESEAEFEETCRGLRYARHFQPPLLAPFVLAQDSPLERSVVCGEHAGFRTEVPGFLRRMVPAEAVDLLGRMLLTFVGKRPAAIDPSRTELLHRMAEGWRARYERNHRRPGLVLRRGDGFAVLEIRDGDRRQHLVLDGAAADVYLACMEESRTHDEIRLGTQASDFILRTVLRELQDRELLYGSEGRYLALACYDDAGAPRSGDTSDPRPASPARG